MRLAAAVLFAAAAAAGPGEARASVEIFEILIDDSANVPEPNEPNTVNASADPGETVSLSIGLTNTGGSTFGSLEVELAVSYGGVPVSIGEPGPTMVSSYPVLDPNQMGVNDMPFVVPLLQTLRCGGRLSLQLIVRNGGAQVARLWAPLSIGRCDCLDGRVIHESAVRTLEEELRAPRLLSREEGYGLFYEAPVGPVNELHYQPTGRFGESAAVESFGQIRGGSTPDRSQFAVSALGTGFIVVSSPPSILGVKQPLAFRRLSLGGETIVGPVTLQLGMQPLVGESLALASSPDGTLDALVYVDPNMPTKLRLARLQQTSTVQVLADVEVAMLSTDGAAAGPRPSVAYSNGYWIIVWEDFGNVPGVGPRRSIFSLSARVSDGMLSGPMPVRPPDLEDPGMDRGGAWYSSIATDGNDLAVFWSDTDGTLPGGCEPSGAPGPAPCPSAIYMRVLPPPGGPMPEPAVRISDVAMPTAAATRPAAVWDPSLDAFEALWLDLRNDTNGACEAQDCVRQIYLQRVKGDGTFIDEDGAPCGGGCNERAWQDLAIGATAPLAARSSDGTGHLIFAEDGNILDRPFVGVRLSVDPELWVKQDPGEQVVLNDGGPLSAAGELGRAQGDLAAVWSETTAAFEVRLKLRRAGLAGLEPSTVLVDSAAGQHVPGEASNVEAFADDLAVAFVDHIAGFGGDPSAHVQLLMPDPNLAPPFRTVQVDPTDADWSRVRIAALGDSIGVAYEAGGVGVKLRRIDSVVTQVSTEIGVDAAGKGVQIAALEDRFAVAYLSGGRTWVRFYGLNETLLAGPVALTSSGNEVSAVALAGMGDRVAVLYDESVVGQNRRLWFDVLDPNGVPLDPNVPITTLMSPMGDFPDLGLAFTGHELVASWTAPVGPPRWVRILPDGTIPSIEEPVGFYGSDVHIASQFDGSRFGFGVSSAGGDLTLESFVPPSEAYASCKIHNTSPTLTVHPEDPNAPFNVVLDANDPNAVVLTLTAAATSGAGGSSDPGDDTLLFEWDLNCDGQQDFQGASLPLSSSQLASFGIDFPQIEPYLLCLRVTDSQGGTAEAQVQLFVQDATDPSVTLTAPNGGESWPVGSMQRITWSATDDSELEHFELYYSTTAARRDSTDCTDPGRGSTGWEPIDPNVPGDTSFLDWTVPNALSATVRLCVVAVDAWGNSSGDISNDNLYFIQATTSAVRTVILAHLGRMEARYPGSSGPLLSKLGELAGLDSVIGAQPLLLENVEAVEIALDAWDAAHAANPSTSQDEALAAAAAIHDYLWDPNDGQLSTVYTEARYIVIVGDDAMLPAFRVADGTGILPESSYGGLSALPVSTVEAALGVTGPFPAGAFLSDDYYGASEPLSTAVGELWLPDLAVGRLIETPDEIQAQINRYIALDGVTTGTHALVMGYDFLQDSSEDIEGVLYGAGLNVESVIDDTWDPNDLRCRLLGETACAVRPTLYALNTHADHDQLGTGQGPLLMSSLPAGAGQMDGAIVLGMGCHSGLPAPAGEPRSQDVTQTLLGLGAAVVIGQYGYGWGLQDGVGLTEELMRRVSEQLVVAASVAVGDALVAAKQDYFLSVYRYDVFDHKVLQQTVYYGLPMLRLETGVTRSPRTAPLFTAAGPDGREARSGVTADKSTRGEPGGLTRLELSFAFDPNTFECFDTSRGSFCELNGIATAEIGNPLEPMFTYDSTLSGTQIRGVLFVGGGYTEQTGWDPVVGTPQSENTPDPGGEGPLPNSTGWVPIGRTGGSGGSNRSSTRAAGGQSRLEVPVGHYLDGGRHRLFHAMDLVAYYSNSEDTTPPQITDPGPSGVLHTGISGGLRFDVTASDSGGGLLRVLLTYSDEQGLWRSLDLAPASGPSGLWTGELTGIAQALYFVQAVDTSGNASYLGDATQDTDPSGDEWGTETLGPRLFAATGGTGATPTPTATRTPPPTATRTATPPGPTPTATPPVAAVPAPGYRPELLVLLAGLLPLFVRRSPRPRSGRERGRAAG